MRSGNKKGKDNKKLESELDSKKKLFSLPNKNRKSEANIHSTEANTAENSASIFASLRKKNNSSYSLHSNDLLSCSVTRGKLETTVSCESQNYRSDPNWKASKPPVSRNGRKHSANCHIIHRPGCSSSLADVSSTVLATSGIKQVINYSLPESSGKTASDDEPGIEFWQKTGRHSVSCKEHRKRESLKEFLASEASRSKSFSSSTYDTGM